MQAGLSTVQTIQAQPLGLYDVNVLSGQPLGRDYLCSRVRHMKPCPTGNAQESFTGIDRRRAWCPRC